MKQSYRFFLHIVSRSLLFVLSIHGIAAGQIVSWNLTSATTTATAADPNLTASTIAVVPSTAISYQTSPGDIYCGSWSTSATFSTTGKYWEFSITPNPGYEVTVSSVTFKAGRTSTGPAKMQVQYSLDGFATAGTTALGETGNSNTSALDQFSLTSLPPATTSAVTFRIWGYAASSTGNFRLNNIVVSGSVVSNAASGSGIGSAQVSPTLINAQQTSDFTIKVASNETDTISNIVVIIPAAFTWSMNASDVTLLGSSLSGANLAVTQDTISITKGIVSGTDTGVVVIHSITVPDSSMTGLFIVKTSIDAVPPSPVGSKMAVTVVKVIRIVDLHVNDSQGVPVAPYQIGAVVTVSGIVTADFSTPPQTSIFIQDATGGVNIFSFTHSYNYQIGDSITFTGAIQQFRGSIEIVPDSAKTIIHSHNNLLPEPLLLTCADVNQTFNDDFSEPNEGRLVRINRVTYNAVNTTITDITGTTGGFVPTPVVAPAGTFDMIGILKQFKPGSTSTMTPPYTSDYEVEARIQSDIITAEGPAFAVPPSEKDIQPNSVVISFKTASPSTAVVRYGKGTTYSDSVVAASSDTAHEITINGLWPSTVYHYNVSANDTSGTNTTGDGIFSTASPSSATGTINVYFNYAVDASVAVGETAQTVNIVDKFIHRIQSAQHSIDYAFYSLSGTVGANIASALVDARGRGVSVRLIAEYDNSSTAPINTVKGSGIPFITDKFDATNNGAGLMHNKFAVFDYRDTSSAGDDWIWTGSWNATDPGNGNDAQNSLEIQDQALAHAYTMEFNEMWGSDTDVPNASMSRFGVRKFDNTPHRFNVKGTPVELYFSPSDQTTLHIYETLAASVSSINVCIYTFTRSDLAQELVQKKSAGEKVRIVMDNNTDSGNQYSYLQSNGMDLHLKGSDVAGLLHHKYAVVDAEAPNADQVVITGSHNWSNAAETNNSENTLIIHDKKIANLYLQEFKLRYLNAGGTDVITVGVIRTDSKVPRSTALSQNYPNPFNPTTNFELRIARFGHVSVKVFDLLGREVATLVDDTRAPGVYTITWDASKLASGMYLCRMNAEKFTETKKLLFVR